MSNYQRIAEAIANRCDEYLSTEYGEDEEINGKVLSKDDLEKVVIEELTKVLGSENV